VEDAVRLDRRGEGNVISGECFLLNQVDGVATEVLDIPSDVSEAAIQRGGPVRRRKLSVELDMLPDGVVVRDETSIKLLIGSGSTGPKTVLDVEKDLYEEH
jgi:hypothetical protein